MSAHAPNLPTDDAAAPKRFKPHQLVIAIGIFMGVFTLLSGIIPQFTNWHGDEVDLP